jgi:hypothetical protein
LQRYPPQASVVIGASLVEQALRDAKDAALAAAAAWQAASVGDKNAAMRASISASDGAGGAKSTKDLVATFPTDKADLARKATQLAADAVSEAVSIASEPVSANTRASNEPPTGIATHFRSIDGGDIIIQSSVVKSDGSIEITGLNTDTNESVKYFVAAYAAPELRELIRASTGAELLVAYAGKKIIAAQKRGSDNGPIGSDDSDWLSSYPSISFDSEEDYTRLVNESSNESLQQTFDTLRAERKIVEIKRIKIDEYVRDEWDRGGSLFVLGGESTSPSRLVTCLIDYDDAGVLIGDLNPRIASVSGIVSSYSDQSGLRLDPCVINNDWEKNR